MHDQSWVTMIQQLSRLTRDSLSSQIRLLAFSLCWQVRREALADVDEGILL
jgi:hypothetical protein